MDINEYMQPEQSSYNSSVIPSEHSIAETIGKDVKFTSTFQQYSYMKSGASMRFSMRNKGQSMIRFTKELE